MMYADSLNEDQEYLMITPPEHLRNFIELPSGEKVLYFRENEWVEFSTWLYTAVVNYTEETVVMAVKPLMEENKRLERQKKTWRWIGLGTSAVALLTTTFFLLK